MATVYRLEVSYFCNICQKLKLPLFRCATVQYNLVKIGQSAAELLRIFDYENSGRPPSWIWNDVIADHPQLVIDGPNILLKLHVDRIYFFQDIAIFIFGRFGLKLPIHVPCGEFFVKYYPQDEFQYCRNPQKDRPWAKARRMSHKL